ncbi:MAG: hypothetical protein ABI208_03350 [Ginsengibacter sp.]
MVIGAKNIFRFQIKNHYLKLIFSVYFIWLLFVIFRDATDLTNYLGIKKFLFNSDGFGGLIYFVPLALFLPPSPVFLKKTFDVIIIFGFFYLLLSALFIKKLLISGDDAVSQELLELISSLSLPTGFLILTYIYHPNKKKVFAFAIIFITLLFAVYRARRGLTLLILSIISFSYLMFLFETKKKHIIIYFSILSLLLVMLYSNRMYKINDSRIFGALVERGTDDTRSNIELLFYDDMKINDWIIGKGLNGEYFCPNIEENQPTNFRNVIETGYLQIILKGGFISLGLLLLILVPAFIKGIFFSKNMLSKGAGIWILLFLTALYPRDPVHFDLSYLLVWISVGICYSKDIRNMTENKLRQYLQFES